MPAWFLIAPALICFAFCWALLEAAFTHIAIEAYKNAAICGASVIFALVSFLICIYGSIFY